MSTTTPIPLPTVRLDAGACKGLLDALAALVDDIDGYETEVDPDAGPAREALARDGDKERRKALRAQNAELSRDLLRGAARARTLASEIEELYWNLKGHADPRDAG